MRAFSIILALAAFALGLVAARDWFLASRIDIEPVWGDREPLDPVASQAGWIAGMLTASLESARLNKRAAALTGIAVVLTTGAGLAGLFV